jgi:hypothetical protein
MYPNNRNVDYAPVGGVTVCSYEKILIFNLVTKRFKSHKPTYDDLKKSLITLRDKLELWEVKKLAIPLLGCGLDGLNWNIVFPMIRNVLQGLEIDLYIHQL